MSGGMMAASVDVPDAVPRSNSPNNNFTRITAGYFETIGLPLVAGRAFNDDDNETGSSVAIVNEEFVRHDWDDGPAVGRRFTAMGRDVTVAGVVRTAEYRYVRDEPEIMVYLPLWQRMSTELTLHARIAGAVGPASAALSEIVRDLDPNIPVYGVGTIDDHLDAQS